MNTSYVYQSAQVGEFRQALLTAKGPSAYSQTTGDPVSNPGANEYISFANSCVAQSGNYAVTFTPAAAGAVRAGAASPSQSGYTARWTYSGNASAGKTVTSAAVTAGSGYTAGTYKITTTGGSGTRQAILSVVVNVSGQIASATVIDPGVGFATAPTVPLTALGSGTSGAVTPTVTTVTPGAEVATGAILSGETVQFGAVVTQL